MSTEIINELFKILKQRRTADPSTSYVAGLYAEGSDQILKKIGEEAAELLIAGKGGLENEIIHETADLWFHSLVLLAYNEIDADRIMSELERRLGKSGLEEKVSRPRK
ncbi:MAG TPA: phosphoribosyl-ATP diphosphatase [Gammaproteobacteria bacterium]|nr:phosphoribosyl-ATP diphosphatase [Gammaproteobacteria bacterium]|tara:strand:+ start:1689 stop:2012 length:324 start_codon:yes stop_codon:yes gene_type:complete